ncbi:MAG: hypothetical protein K0Q97_3124, partial [Bacillota bacterium]|nr:hypothetical protein [Bacillota bacterium]
MLDFDKDFIRMLDLGMFTNAENNEMNTNK